MRARRKSGASTPQCHIEATEYCHIFYLQSRRAAVTTQTETRVNPARGARVDPERPRLTFQCPQHVDKSLRIHTSSHNYDNGPRQSHGGPPRESARGARDGNTTRWRFPTSRTHCSIFKRTAINVGVSLAFPARLRFDTFSDDPRRGKKASRLGEFSSLVHAKNGNPSAMTYD